MTHLERIDGESCVKEREKERYCWRSGVMSRNEGEEEEGLFVWRVFLHLKAHTLSRVTVEREGMSVGEDRMIGSTFQSDETKLEECETILGSSECSEFRQVYSSVHLIITTSHNQFTRGTILEEMQCSITKPNGRQCRQV